MGSLRPQSQNTSAVSTGFQKNSHLVLALQATEGSVFAVEAILQVNLGLPDEVVCSDHVMVIDQDGEQGLLWERGLDLK